MFLFREEFGSPELTMIREKDQVVLNIDIPEYGLAAGDIGAVIMANPGENSIKVNFFTLRGDLVVSAELQRSDVRNIQDREIAHVRAIVKDSGEEEISDSPNSRN